MTLSLYRTFTTFDNPEQLEFSLSAKSASYTDSGSEHGLMIVQPDPGSFKITDNQMKWSIAEYGLNLSLHLEMKNLAALFGIHGIASSNSSLGLAFIIESPSSNRQECHVITTINKNSGQICLDKTINLAPHLFFRDFTVQTIIYLVSSNDEEIGFASEPGTILGLLNTENINAPFTDLPFPIYKVSEEKATLWWVECRWNDATVDLFTEDNVCIRLNTANKYYELLNTDNKQYSKPLLSEIVSSATHLIIHRAMQNEDEWKRITTDSNLPEGSIAAVLRNMYDTFQWDFSSEEKLAKSIREYIYREVNKW